MKKALLTFALLLFGWHDIAAAPKPTYLEEIKSLGAVAGEGLACRAKKYHQFELLARAILVGKAPNSKLQQEAMRTYNNAKVGTYTMIYDNGFENCDDIVYNFNRQKIFSSVLYSDGRVKLYDGTMITPRKPYDASKLYKKDPNVYAKAEEAYKKAVAQAQKNSKNAKKVPFRDANYSRYANQF